MSCAATGTARNMSTIAKLVEMAGVIGADAILGQDRGNGRSPEG